MSESAVATEESLDQDVFDSFGGLSLAESKYEDVYEDPCEGEQAVEAVGLSLAESKHEDVYEDAVEGAVEVGSASGSLYLMNDTGALDLKGENITMVLVRVDDFDYEVRLWSDENTFIFNQPVGNSMQLTFEKTSNSIEWISFHGEQVLAWRFGFDNAETAKSFKTSLSVALMESSRQEKFTDIIKKDDAQWIEEGYFEVDDENYPDNESSDYKDDEGFDFDNYEPRKSPQKQDFEEKDVNKNLNISQCRNRTFVFNGSSIGVFKHDEEDQLEFINKVNPVFTQDGEEFAPTHSMLHESDNKLLMLNPNTKDRVYVMDLHRGSVVDEWQAGSAANFNIRNFAPCTKYAQLTDQKVFAGVSYNGLFLLDPRVNGNNKMTHNYFYQSTSPDFSCLATNGEGHVVVGSHKGEIRMFNGINQKRSKTKLPGLGDGIVSLDVTQNGKWILATTQNYLLVVPTEIEGDVKNRTGFQVGMGKKKRKPIKLCLSHSDMIKYNINEVDFKSASFDTGENIEEEWIVTSTGSYLVTWDFRKVKRGIRDCYKIKRTGEIIEAKFRYAKKDQVVVNMPHDIYTEKRSVK